MPAHTNTMSPWMRRATPDQKRQLAKAAKTSVGQLKHMAAGRRGASAELAQRLATGSRTLKQRALYLDQRELCPACGMCPLVKQRKTPKVKAA